MKYRRGVFANIRSLRIGVVLMSVVVATIDAEENQWRKLPPPPGRADYVASIAVEGNRLWAMAGNSVAHWNGREWHPPAVSKLRAGMYLATLVGGGDRPLYCTQPGQRDRWGEIYELKDTEARLVTEFRYDVVGMKSSTTPLERAMAVFAFSPADLAFGGFTPTVRSSRSRN